MLFFQSGPIQVNFPYQKQSNDKIQKEDFCMPLPAERLICTWAAFTWFKKSLELYTIALLNLGELATALEQNTPGSLQHSLLAPA